MTAGWATFAIATWLVLLVNLAITLRLVRQLRVRQRDDQGRPELAVGQPAPDFRATDLAGRPASLTDYRGRETALVFVSPRCGSCAAELPELAALADLGRRTRSAELVLVSDRPAAETAAWLAGIADRQPAVTGLRLLAGGAGLADYNPRGLTPYFCHLDADGRVTARGGLRSPAWASIAQRWEAGPNPMRSANRFV